MQNPFVNWISELLWPKECLGCSARGVVLCGACLLSVPLHPKVTNLSGVCAVTSVASLGTPVLSSALWHLKYRNMPALAAPLAGWLAHALGAVPAAIAALTEPTTVLIPVPLHARRIRERGYNQAELLARCLGVITTNSVATNLLIRSRNTPSQVTSAGRVERIANMADAFCCPDPDLVRGRSFLLVDDVCTTGATLRACANTLKFTGARGVEAVVIARP